MKADPCPCCGSPTPKVFEKEETIGNIVAHTTVIFCSGRGCNISCEAPVNRVFDMWNRKPHD